MEIKSGLVKVYRTEKGYGIIKPDEPGPDVFMHFSTISDPLVRSRMIIGLPVLYKSRQDETGWKTTDVWLDNAFVMINLPPEKCGGYVMAIRDETQGTVEVFRDVNLARQWIDAVRMANMRR